MTQLQLSYVLLAKIKVHSNNLWLSVTLYKLLINLTIFNSDTIKIMVSVFYFVYDLK